MLEEALGWGFRDLSFSANCQQISVWLWGVPETTFEVSLFVCLFLSVTGGRWHR